MFCSTLDGIWTHTIDSLQHHSLSLTSNTQVTLRSSGTDILYGCHLLRRLYNILYFLWLYNEFFIILYNILTIAELDCCQVIVSQNYRKWVHTCIIFWKETCYYIIYIYIYIYIRLKIKPNSVRIRFLSCQIFVLPSTGFELTPLIHCSTNRRRWFDAVSTGWYHSINNYFK
jgi:hypothetical protein